MKRKVWSAARSSRKLQRKALVLAIGSVACGVAGAALAQNANQANAQSSSKSPETLKTIIVTGSAIPRTDYETASPVRVITDEQIKASGFTNVADVVRSISADNSGTIPNAFSNGFAAGASGVALRGLRASNTLVLIDGHRVANYSVADDGTRSFVDLNTIPLEAVERIEVLKDGASSIYGSDAIAGVVNIILKPTYQGAQVSAEIGDSQHGGGFEKRITGMFGAGNLETEGHNAYIDFMYEKDNTIRANQRDYPFNTDDLTGIGYFDNRIGNPANSNGSIYGTVAPATLGTPGDLQTGVQIPGSLYQPLQPCGANSQSITVAGSGTYCAQDATNQYGVVQPSLQRDGIHGRFTFKVGDNAVGYLDAYYMESKLQTVDGPAQIQAGTPNNTDSIALPPTLPDGLPNPNNPFAAAGQYALINYAFGDIPSYSHYHNHSLRLEGDLSGSLGAWNYDANLVLNHTWLNSDLAGFIDFNQLMTDVADGTYNFVDPASNSGAVRSALAPLNAKNSTSDLDAFDFTVNRDFGEMGGQPIGVAFGGQFRHEAQNDPNLNPNLEYQGLGQAHAIGSRNVGAVFGEVDFHPISSIETDVSARLDHYAAFGTSFTPKVGIKWTPIQQLAFRGTYSRGFRAPSFSESGNALSEGFVLVSIPTSSPLYAAHHGNNYVTVPYNLAELSSANPDLKPERSSSATLGVVFQPTSWFNGTLDYYAIRLTSVIVPSNPSNAFNAYVNGQPIPPGYGLTTDVPDPEYPTAPPRPLVISSPFINANSQNTDGIDLNLVFHHDFGPVNFRSDFNATKIISFSTSFPDGTHQQYVGTQSPYNLSSGAGTPRYRASWSNTIKYGPLTGTATVYYVSGEYMSALDVFGPGCAANAFGPAGPSGVAVPVPPNCRMASFTDIDLTGSWQITHNVSINGAILNAADRSPPLDIINYAQAGDAYNPTYAQAGIVGRFFKVGVEVKFGGGEPAPLPAAPPPPPPPPAAPPPPPPPQNVVIDLRGVNFKFDRPKPGEHDIGPTLKPPADASLAILSQAVDTLNRYPQVQIQIDGYTDSIGTDAYNQKLSDRRANIVDAYLTSHGIAASRITGVKGFGESDPIDTNKTAAGRQRNRRVEFKVEGQGFTNGADQTGQQQ